MFSCWCSSFLTALYTGSNSILLLGKSISGGKSYFFSNKFKSADIRHLSKKKIGTSRAIVDIAQVESVYKPHTIWVAYVLEPILEQKSCAFSSIQANQIQEISCFSSSSSIDVFYQ